MGLCGFYTARVGEDTLKMYLRYRYRYLRAVSFVSLDKDTINKNGGKLYLRYRYRYKLPVSSVSFATLSKILPHPVNRYTILGHMFWFPMLYLLSQLSEPFLTLRSSVSSLSPHPLRQWINVHSKAPPNGSEILQEERHDQRRLLPRRCHSVQSL